MLTERVMIDLMLHLEVGYVDNSCKCVCYISCNRNIIVFYTFLP